MSFSDCAEIITAYYGIFMRKIANKSKELLKKAIRDQIIKLKKKTITNIDNKNEEKDGLVEKELSNLHTNINISKLFNFNNEEDDENDDDEQFLEKLTEEEMLQIIEELNQTRLEGDWIANANKKIGMQKAAAIGKKLLTNIKNEDESQEISLKNLSSIKKSAQKQSHESQLQKVIHNKNQNKLKLSKYKY